MANPLVEHLRKAAAGERSLARLAVRAGGKARRAMLARLKGLSLARLFLGTTLAFACGVGLGVGVATVIAPEAAVIGRMILDLPGNGATARDGQGSADGPVIAVRLRKEGGHSGDPQAESVVPHVESAGPPIAVFAPAEPKSAAKPPAVSAPAQPEQPAAVEPPAEPPSMPSASTAAAVPGGPAETKADPAPAVETVARAPVSQAGEPASAPQPQPARTENHVSVPLADVAPARKDAPAELPAAAPSAVAPSVVATTGAAKDGTGEAAPAPAEAAPAAESPAVETAMVEPARPVDAPLATPAPAEAVPQYQYEEKAPPVSLSDLNVALGPAGLDGLLGSSAPKAEAGDEAGDDAAAVKLPPRPVPKNLQLAALPMPRADAWIRNAIAMPEKRRDVVIALIIDDLGIDQKRSWAMIALQGPLTLSFIPYGHHLHALTSAARKAGHEVMLHMPMEPMDPKIDPGPNALRTTLSVEENRQRLLWALTRVDGIVGLNNHMGSKFTTWRDGMEMVIQEVQEHGLLFVDSFTSSKSVGFRLARADGLPSAARDVFIDDDISRAGISQGLERLEKVARRRGFAVGIAHPHDLTREALKTWMVEVRSRGIDFVPISYIIRQHLKLAGDHG
jgi:uncharacterized protein